MKIDAMKWGGVLLIILALMAGSAWAAWTWQDNAYGKRLATLRATHNADLTAIADVASAQVRQALEKQQAAQKSLAELDVKTTKEKAHELAENEKLRADVAAGDRRLRIAGRCNASSSDLPDTTSPARVDDGGAVELTGAAGRAVFVTRAGIIKDRAALKGLQEYVRKVCQ